MKSSVYLSQRELRALNILGRFRFLTRTQLQSFLFGSNGSTTTLSAQTMTFRILNSLVAKGLINRTSRAIGGSTGGSGAHAYHLTINGIRALDDRTYMRLPRRLPPRGTFLLRHALATADVALAFERSASSHLGHDLLSFECDWEAAQRFGQRIVVPDAYLVYTSSKYELHAFVEVDLGTAGSKFFARKIANYLALYRSNRWREATDVWPVVLVTTPDERRTRLLRRATESLLIAQPDSFLLTRATEFAFASLKTIQELDPLGCVWEVAGKPDRQALIAEEPLE